MMSIFELQIDAGQFLAAQRAYLRRLALCPPLLPPVNGVQVVLDRVDVGSSSLRHDEEEKFDVFYIDHGEVVGAPEAADGFRTLLVQRLILQLTTDDQIRTHANADPPLVSWRCSVAYELSAYALGQDCYLRAAPDSIDFDPPPALPVPLPPGVIAALKDFLSSQLRILTPSGTVPLGLDALKLPTGFLNAGLTVDVTGATLAIRAEVRASQDLAWAAWTNFYRGFIPDRRAGRDWSLFVASGYVTSNITDQLWQNIPQTDDLEAYPGATYFPEDRRARFVLDALLIYHAIQVNALDIDITVEADPTVSVSLWVERPNRLAALIDFTGLANPEGVLSTLAVWLIDALNIPARGFLYRLVGAMIVDALKDEPVDTVTTPSPSTVLVEKDVVLPIVGGFVGATLTDLLALPDGVALAGSLSLTEPSNAAVTVLGVSQFAKHVPKISCGAASAALVALFEQDPSAFAILRAGVFFGNIGTAPLHLCGPPSLLRLDGPVQPNSIRVDEVGLPIELSIDIGKPADGYYAAPFPIDVLVRTNGGTRLIRFDPPPRVTQQDLDRLKAGLLVAIGNCEQLVDPWFNQHRGYNPQWSPRPPEDGSVIHQWEVTVTGLPEGEAVELRGAGGRVLARAVSIGARTAVRVGTIVEPAEGGREVGIFRVDRGLEAGPVASSDGGTASRGLQVRQTDLVVDGEVQLGEATHAIGLIQLPGGPAVIALLAGRAVALDVFSSGQAIPLASWKGHFTGLVRVRGATILYGASGLARLDPTGTLTYANVDAPVSHAMRIAGGTLLATADRILHFSPELALIGQRDRSSVESARHDVTVPLAGMMKIRDRIVARSPRADRLRLLRVGRRAVL